MSLFNRIVAVLLWLALFAAVSYVAVTPFRALDQAQGLLATGQTQLQTWQENEPANFVIAQVAIAVFGLLLFGTLITLEVWTGRRRGVRIRTADGGSAELDTASIGRRLEWHLDQLAEIITVVPVVKSRGGSVDVRLEIETAPDVDVPMKTDEVVEVTRDVIEADMGLKLGKLDVRMRYAPYDTEWA